jgi:hypothetical protein
MCYGKNSVAQYKNMQLNPRQAFTVLVAHTMVNTNLEAMLLAFPRISARYNVPFRT